MAQSCSATNTEQINPVMPEHNEDVVAHISRPYIYIFYIFMYILIYLVYIGYMLANVTRNLPSKPE